jgi:hypothetical protein
MSLVTYALLSTQKESATRKARLPKGGIFGARYSRDPICISEYRVFKNDPVIKVYSQKSEASKHEQQIRRCVFNLKYPDAPSGRWGERHPRRASTGASTEIVTSSCYGRSTPVTLKGHRRTTEPRVGSQRCETTRGGPGSVFVLGSPQKSLENRGENCFFFFSPRRRRGPQGRCPSDTWRAKADSTLVQVR